MKRNYGKETIIKKDGSHWRYCLVQILQAVFGSAAAYAEFALGYFN